MPKVNLKTAGKKNQQGCIKLGSVESAVESNAGFLTGPGPTGMSALHVSPVFQPARGRQECRRYESARAEHSPEEPTAALGGRDFQPVLLYTLDPEAAAVVSRRGDAPAVRLARLAQGFLADTR
jgi:hypothetical protein